ncbi:MAG: hypothetical protein WC916_00580 [Candidatus Woesearchaeota archaeon]
MTHSTLESRTHIETLKEKYPQTTVKELFKELRLRYLTAKGVSDRDTMINNDLDQIVNEISSELAVHPTELWGSAKFQLAYRVTRPEHLALLGIDESQIRSAQEAVEHGRVMSVLPYNMLMSETTLKKYLPSRSEKFSGNWRHSVDPYGIFKKFTKVISIDSTGKETYLATRKFPYAVLANITESCPIGCDGCYKGSMVRTSLAALEEILPEFGEIKKQLRLEEERAVDQARKLTAWLNQNLEVDTVVISGGEPALYSNNTLKRILDEYKNAKYVEVVRICTSSVFQGMWYRIDDELANLLHDFEGSSKKKFYINAHVTAWDQLAAPEAKIAVDKLRNKGISIHLQMPVQEGINFRRDDMEWTVNKLESLSKKAYELGVIPYKMILDMHSPSDPAVTIPLETFTKAIGYFDRHEENSDQERWQAYNILHEQGNNYLVSYPHFTAVKMIDTQNKVVTYFIPKVDYKKGKRIEVHTYTEPLIARHNDDPTSMNTIADKDIVDKIAQVQHAYLGCSAEIEQIEKQQISFQEKINAIEEIEKEFYTISGITYPENKPLVE